MKPSTALLCVGAVASRATYSATAVSWVARRGMGQGPWCPRSTHREKRISPAGRGDADTPLQMSPVVTVGWTAVANLCHVPVLVGNLSYSALVDTGSTASLVRSDVSVGTILEQAGVKLQTVTAGTSSMKGRVTFPFRLGKYEWLRCVTLASWGLIFEIRGVYIKH